MNTGITFKTYADLGWTRVVTGYSILHQYFDKNQDFFVGQGREAFFGIEKSKKSIVRKSSEDLLFTGGVGPVFSMGKKDGRIHSFGVLLGVNPYNGLSLLFVSDFTAFPFNIRKVENLQLYIGISGTIMINMDVNNNYHTYFGLNSTLGIPLGIKYFFHDKKFDVFAEIVPNFTGLSKYYLFVNTNTLDKAYGAFSSDLLHYFNIGFSLGLRYWLN